MARWHGGKGSDYRKVNAKKFSDGYDLAFGKKDDKLKRLEKEFAKLEEMHRDKKYETKT